MIATLLVTIIVEGAVVFVYSVWRHKPLRTLLLNSFWINLFTQSLLWAILMISFRQYLITLVIAEILIWGIESLLLFAIPADQLKLSESILLSLGMNFASLTFGLFLRV